MSDERITTLFQRYNELLEDMLGKSTKLNESMLRKALFQSLDEKYNITSLELKKYPSTSWKPVDVHTAINSTFPKLAFEFHLENSPRTQANQTQRAGILFSHFHRLALFNMKVDYERYLVFNTDETMAKYFSRERESNDLTEIWNLSNGQSLKIDEDYYLKRSKSFKEKANFKQACKVSGIYKADKFGHPWYWTRIYKVEPIMKL